MKQVRACYFYVDHKTKPLRIVTNIHLASENIGLGLYEAYPITMEWIIEHKGHVIYQDYQNCLVTSIADCRGITKKCLAGAFAEDTKVDMFTKDDLEGMIDRVYNIIRNQPYEMLITLADAQSPVYTIH